MQRYFVSPEHMSDDQVIIEGEDVRHIVKVMRSSVGDRIICCNGLGICVLARIEQINKDQVICGIVEQAGMDRELPVFVSLAQGLPKGDKMDLVIQKGTELGAREFVPFFSARTIVQLDEKKEQKRLERWRKISKEAAEQSHRSFIPVLHSMLNWEQLIHYSKKFDLALLAYEHESSYTIHEALTMVPEGSRILLVIGPEGGFSDAEVKEAMECGMKVVMLGKRILRTETAGLYGLSCISYYFELLGGR